MVLTGLRGVGKTVLLNALRSAAVRRGWGTGKLEARPDRSLRRPLAAALHLAIRELGAPAGEPDHVLGVLKSFAQREPAAGRAIGPRRRRRPLAARHRRRPPCPAGPTPATSRSTWSSCSPTGRAWPPTPAGASRCSSTRCRTSGPADVSALCAACHELSQRGLPLIVVGAGLPHLPAVLSASKSYSERLFRYARIDRLDRAAADAALQMPARDEDAEFTDDALAAMYALTGGYPYFVQAYGKAVWDCAPRLADHRGRRRGGRARGGRRTGGRFLRLPLGTGHPGRARVPAGDGRRGRRRRVERRRRGADRGGRRRCSAARPQSLSPARDALLKKGLVYSGERGRIAFTVPHFGRYLRAQELTAWRLARVLADPGMHRDAGRDAGVDRAGRAVLGDRADHGSPPRGPRRRGRPTPGRTAAATCAAASTVSIGTAPGRLSTATTV